MPETSQTDNTNQQDQFVPNSQSSELESGYETMINELSRSLETGEISSSKPNKVVNNDNQDQGEVQTTDSSSDNVDTNYDSDSVQVDDSVHNVNAEVQEPNKQDQQEKQDLVEQIAREQGWTDKDSFHGDEADYVDAATYLRRSPDIQNYLKTALKNQRQELKQMKAGIEHLKIHNEKVYKAKLQDLQAQLKDLKQQRIEAVEEADTDRFQAIESQIDQVYEQVNDTYNQTLPKEMQADQVQSQTQSQPDPAPEFKAWNDKNKWFGKDEEMTTFADNIALKYKDSGLSFDRVTKIIDKEIKQVFFDKFDQNGQYGKPKQSENISNNAKNNSQSNLNTRRPPANPVDSSSNRNYNPNYSQGNQNVSFSDLTDQQRQVAKFFIDNGIYKNTQEYITNLKKTGELR